MICKEIITVAPGNHTEPKIFWVCVCVCARVEAEFFNIEKGFAYNYHRQYSTDLATIFIYNSRILSPGQLVYMTI